MRGILSSAYGVELEYGAGTGGAASAGRVPRRQRRAPFFTAWRAAEPGPLQDGVWYDPGSAQHREERCSASGKRGLACCKQVRMIATKETQQRETPMSDSTERPGWRPATYYPD